MKRCTVEFVKRTVDNQCDNTIDVFNNSPTSHEATYVQHEATYVQHEATYVQHGTGNPSEFLNSL